MLRIYRWLADKLEMVGAAIATLFFLFVWRESNSDRGGRTKPERTFMSLDLTLLTSAVANGRTALTAFNDGKRFTAIQFVGKATDNLGEFGAKATNEGVDLTPTFGAEATDGGMSVDVALTTAEQKMSEIAVAQRQTAGPEDGAEAAAAAGDPAKLAPGVVSLILFALKKLLERL